MRIVPELANLILPEATNKSWEVWPHRLRDQVSVATISPFGLEMIPWLNKKVGRCWGLTKPWPDGCKHIIITTQDVTKMLLLDRPETKVELSVP